MASYTSWHESHENVMFYFLAIPETSGPCDRGIVPFTLLQQGIIIHKTQIYIGLRLLYKQPFHSHQTCPLSERMP